MHILQEGTKKLDFFFQTWFHKVSPHSKTHKLFKWNLGLICSCLVFLREDRDPISDPIRLSDEDNENALKNTRCKRKGNIRSYFIQIDT